MLKHGCFPWPRFLSRSCAPAKTRLGSPVEIEFAVRLPQAKESPPNSDSCRSGRWLLSRDIEDLARGRRRSVTADSARAQRFWATDGSTICSDVVVVDSQRFERSRSQEVAQAVAHFNATLNAENRPYLLIGVGRWGSNDPWLGIPVEWDEISGARAIVESGFRDFRVTPRRAVTSSRTSPPFRSATSPSIPTPAKAPSIGNG